jgi:PAS domain S-box-containing protein
MVRKDGRERMVEGYVTVLRHHDRIVGFQGTLRDITERIRAEEALAEEKERLAVTLRSIGDGVITTDTKGTVVLINRAAELLTGFGQNEAAGLPIHEVFHIINEQTRKPCDNPAQKIIGSAGMIELDTDTVLIAKDGTERIIADSGSPIKDRSSNIIGVVLVFRDVTEKKKIEDELRKTQKLESLGTLAGGIAHDYNNILTAILANISLAKMHTQRGDKVSDRLDKMEKAAIMASRLTQQLLTFSRGGAPVKELISLGELIKDSATFALGGTNVRCEFEIQPGLWPVSADVGQISQVINNIIINAQQAMPSGGSVRVSSRNVTITEQDPLPIRRGRYLLLSIADEGVGISPKNLDKIFDPFFTTKEKGSGLGLSTSYSIVKNHDGHIIVQSKEGLGTTFHIYLPASDGSQVERAADPGKPRSGRGKILVMDDEAGVRDVVSMMLGTLGYETETATEGHGAIELFEKAARAGRPFDLIIMDLTIKGGMGGQEALKRLLRIDPSVRAVVSSGYSNDPIMADFRGHGFVGVLAKPYKITTLSELLDRILERGQADS